MNAFVERRGNLPARKISRVLVVRKLTTFTRAHERNDRHTLDLIASGDESARDIKPAHEQDTRSAELVLKLLKARHIPTVVNIRVDRIGKNEIDNFFDLIVVVGGDGTVLDVSHRVVRTPILGVNSAPATSHGHFCLSTPETLARHLDEIESGERQALSVGRLNAFINGERVGPDVLNEIALESPHGSTTYIVKLGEHCESHSSDGMFFALGAGSTAWMRAYGAAIMPVTDRNLQYQVRGKFIAPGKQIGLLQGFANPERLVVISKMDDGKVYVDGRRNSYPFVRGSKLTIKPSPRDVLLYADPHCNQQYELVQAQLFLRRESSRH